MAFQTLSARGLETAKTSMRSVLSPILSDGFDAKTNPAGYVNMGTAENYIMTKHVSEFANRNMTTVAKTFTYGDGAWGSSRLRDAMANHLNEYFHPVTPVNPDHILFTNGITSLCELLGWVMADPGDAVLLSSPTYNAFPTDFGAKARVECVFTPFHGIDQFSPACVDKYEQALLRAEASGTKIRALLLCNPHNPLGKCYPRETIIGLMKLCQKYGIHLLADEIYALSVYHVDDPEAVPFESVLAFDTTPYIDTNLVHLLYGFSKDFASGGLRLGCIYTRNSSLMDGISAITQFAWSGSMNETVATLMLEDKAWVRGFIQKSREALAERNLLVRSLLDEKGIEYYKGSNAGFFIWIDLRPYLPVTNKVTGERIEDEWDREAELVRRMNEKKVYFTDGKSSNAEEAGWFRVIFSQEIEVIEEGFKRLYQIIG